MGCEKWFDFFAVNEAAGSSPSYELLARSCAQDAELCARLDALPARKQQPNLLFSCVRLLGGPTAGWAEFRTFVEDRWRDVEATLLGHAVQTNEVARTAALLPLLAQLPQPLALIEVGASAGLCLYPDRYRYTFQSGDRAPRDLEPGDLDPGDLDPGDLEPGDLEPGDLEPGRHVVGGASPVDISIRYFGDVPIPTALPTVAWRAGVDLNPLEVTSDDDMAWLRACIWPEHDHRLRRLDAAISVVREDPPVIVRGDLVEKIAELISQAPRDATTVVFHSAVLAYCSTARRHAFADLVVGADGVVWISNEVPGVVPGVITELTPPDIATSALPLVLAVGGERAVGLCDGHGAWVKFG